MPFMFFFYSDPVQIIRTLIIPFEQSSKACLADGNADYMMEMKEDSIMIENCVMIYHIEKGKQRDNMNEGLTKKKHPYLELITACIAMLGFPYLTYIMFTAVMREYSKYSPALISAQAEALAGMIGIAFAGILLLAGLFKEPFMVMKERWREFFEDINYGLKDTAFRSFRKNIRENGINFVAFLLLTALQFLVTLDGINRFLAIIKK